MRRTAAEIATQSIIYGALGFRASLEVTEHHRTRELCSQLLPWLGRLGLEDRIMPYHREILEEPHGALKQESRTEAFWRGEEAAFLGWTIQLIEMPDLQGFIDPGLLVDRLKLLKPEAADILSRAELRSSAEVEEFSAFCLLVRHLFQLVTLPEDDRDLLTSLFQRRLTNFGLGDALEQYAGIEFEASSLVSRSPSLRGLYLVRAFACEWLFGVDE